MASGTEYGAKILEPHGEHLKIVGTAQGKHLAKHMGYRKKHTARDKLGTMGKHKGTSGKTCDIKIKEYMCGDIWKQQLRKI